ncbi:hypothetical protein [Muricoccus radiodurans]|uniref:hypothetical protein n=1 Tax=Muricoccus radiodurans TaxID=2231721 RepID=UPI003CF464AA
MILRRVVFAAVFAVACTPAAMSQQPLPQPVPWTRAVLGGGTVVFHQDAVQARVDDPVSGRLLSADELPTLIVACDAAQAAATIEWPTDVAPAPSPGTRAFVLVDIGSSLQTLSASTWVGEDRHTVLMTNGPAQVASWTRQLSLVAKVTGTAGRLVVANFDTRGLGDALRSEGAACAHLLR